MPEAKGSLGEKCKFFEKNFSPEIMIPELPVIIRLDGVGFSKWTKGLDKPFDAAFTHAMIETATHLAKETNAVLVHTQSDEITIMLYQEDPDSHIYHAGKKQKILSKLTGVAVNKFNELVRQYLPKHNKVACFDARIYQVPTLNWATKQFMWREQDAIKNSIGMCADAMFSHKELEGVHSGDKLKMMLSKNYDWTKLQTRFKKGTYIRRIVTKEKMSAEEINTLPPKHHLRQNPDLIIERNVIQQVEYPELKDISNRVDVIFNNQTPKLFI